MDYLVVDAFTREPLRGNPAAVVFLERQLTDKQLQAIATEFNLSETAFLIRRRPGQWQLRWFTPAAEIELCGHATLGSAHAIWDTGRDDALELRFETLSGELRAGRTTDGLIRLQFPSIAVEPATVEEELLHTLKLEPLQISRTKNYFLLELKDRSAVENFLPDATAIANLPARGLIITANNKGADDEADIDFVTRFFAPRLGVPEDPVTGSVHCALAPYWSEKLRKTTLIAKQLSARTGMLYLTVNPDHIVLAGHAVTTMRGVLFI